MDEQSLPTMICRCYEVMQDEVVVAIENGARTINDVKRVTRAGMGLCQGIYCVPQMIALLRELTGQPLTRIVPMTARPPARLVSLSTLEGAVPEPAE
ncbi:MAG: (2Fe-2S)-binding protein [Thermomicrobiales bacterium]